MSGVALRMMLAISAVGAPAGLHPIAFAQMVGQTTDSSEAKTPEPATAPATPTPPAPSPCPPAPGSSRVLGGRTFFVPTFVDSALNLTYVGVRVGAESDKASGVPLGRLGTFDLEQLRAAGTIDLSVTVADRLDVFGSIGGLAGAGNNRRSVLVRGFNYLCGATGGAFVRLYRNEQTGTQIGARASMRYSKGSLFPLGVFAVNLARSPLATLDDIISGDVSKLIVTPTSEVTVGGGVALAQALWTLLSLQSSLRVDWAQRTFEPFVSAKGSRQTVHTHVTSPELGIALGIDGAPRGVPLAGLLEYLMAVAVSKNDLLNSKGTVAEQTAAVSVFYSGQTHVQVGVSAYWRFNLQPIEVNDDNGQLRGSSKPQERGAVLILRSFW